MSSEMCTQIYGKVLVCACMLILCLECVYFCNSFFSFLTTMPRQIGLIKLEGTMGDLTFYKGKGANGKTEALAKTKGGVSSERIATDPNYQRTRENNSEFGRTASFAKAIRLAFNRFSKGTQAELVAILRELLNNDTTSARGERAFENVTNFDKLRGFSFNPDAKYSEVVLGGKINVGTVNATEFNFIFTEGVLVAPEGATHYKLVASGAVIDRATASVVSLFSPATPPTEVAIPNTGAFVPANLTMTYSTLLPTHMMVAGAGIEFYQQVNGQFYPLNNDAKTPFDLVHYRD